MVRSTLVNKNNRVFFFPNFVVGDDLDDPETEEKIKQSMNHHHKMRANRWKLVEYDNEAAWSYFIGTKVVFSWSL